MKEDLNIVDAPVITTVALVNHHLLAPETRNMAKKLQSGTLLKYEVEPTGNLRISTLSDTLLGYTTPKIGTNLAILIKAGTLFDVYVGVLMKGGPTPFTLHFYLRT